MSTSCSHIDVVGAVDIVRGGIAAAAAVIGTVSLAYTEAARALANESC